MSPALPAPADVTVGMIGVPKGADVELEIRLEAVMEGVLITGTAKVPLSGECSRCLDPLTSEIEVGFQELFFYPAETVFSRKSHGRSSGSAGGEDDSVLDGDLLNLEPIFRDAVVLALPLSPMCSDDCPGLCTECGVKLAEAGPDHRHEKIDARWASLQGLVVDNKDDQEG